ASRPPQKKERYVLVTAILLVLFLFSSISGWLFFSNRSNPDLPKSSAVIVTATSPLLTPVTETHVRPTVQGTTVSLQIPTPTPTAQPIIPFNPTTSPASSLVQVSLTSFFNNKGIGSTPGQADFDGSGYSYPASQVPSAGRITVQGIVYQFPGN